MQALVPSCVDLLMSLSKQAFSDGRNKTSEKFSITAKRQEVVKATRESRMFRTSCPPIVRMVSLRLLRPDLVHF